MIRPSSTLLFLILLSSSAAYGQYVNPFPPAFQFFGEQTDSRFGYSLFLGDIDGDGVRDLAAGAPYYDPWHQRNARASDRTDEGELNIFWRAFQAPRTISSVWPLLPSPFNTVISGGYMRDSTTAVLFSGNQFLRFNVQTGQLVTVASPISSFVSQAAFSSFHSGFDCMFENPSDSNRLYFFKGNQVIRIAKPTLQVVESATTIISRFSSALSTYGYASDLTSVIFGQNLKIYFFKGSDYIMWDTERTAVFTAHPPVIKSITNSTFGNVFTGPPSAVFGNVVAQSTTQDIVKQFAIVGNTVVFSPTRFHSNCRWGGLTGRTIVGGKPFTNSLYDDFIFSAPHCNEDSITNTVASVSNGRIWMYSGAGLNGLSFNSTSNANANPTQQGSSLGFAMDYGWGFQTSPAFKYATATMLTDGSWAGRAAAFRGPGLADELVSYTPNSFARSGVAILARGDFNNDGRKDIVMGNARGDTSRTPVTSPAYGGTVHMFVNPTTLSSTATGNHRMIFGPVCGAGFGSTLEAADLNGDGRDDLIIGSPGLGAGRVYIYLNPGGTGTNGGILRGSDPTSHIDGTQGYEEFGACIVRIGDMNRDGFDDLAIGAPQYNDGEGRIFLYFGANSASGFRPTPGQIIRGSSVLGFSAMSSVAHFGHAITSGDLNLDSYPDLIIGAPKYDEGKGTVVVLYSNFQAELSVSILPSSASVALPTFYRTEITAANDGPNAATDVVITLDYTMLKQFSTGPGNPTISVFNGILQSTDLSNPNKIVWHVNEIASGSFIEIAVDFGTLSNAVLFPTSILYSVTVASSVFDPIPENNIASLNVPVQVIADLGFASVSPFVKNAPPYDQVLLTTNADTVIIQQIVVRNYGPAVAFDANLRLVFPRGMLLSSYTITPSSITCIGSASLECLLLNLDPNQEITITDLVLSTSAFTGTAGVSMTLVSGSQEPVPNTLRPNSYLTNTISVQLTSADLIAQQPRASPSVVDAGGALTFFAAFSNIGPLSASVAVASVVIEPDFEEGINVTGVFPTGSATGVCEVFKILTTTPGAINVTCTFTNLLEYDAIAITIVARVSSAVSFGHEMSYYAQIYSPTVPDLDYSNNLVVGSPKIHITTSNQFTLFHRRNSFLPMYLGSTDFVIVTLRNLGPSDLLELRRLCIAFGNTNFDATTLIPPAGCVLESALDSRDVCCDVINMAAGTTATYNVSFTTNAPVNQNFQVVTSISHTPAVSSPTPLTIVVDHRVNLQVNVQLPSDTPNLVTAYQNGIVPLNFAVRNVASNDATNVELVYFLPSGVEYVNGRAGLDNTECTFSEVPDKVVCVIGAIPKFQTRNGIIRLRASTVGTTHHSFEALSLSQVEANPVDNVRTFTMFVQEISDVAIRMEYSPALIHFGGQVILSGSILNFGPGSGRDIVINIEYSLEKATWTGSFESPLSSGGVCSENMLGVIECTFNNLGPGAQHNSLQWLFDVSSTPFENDLVFEANVTQSVLEIGDSESQILNNYATVVITVVPEFVDFAVALSVAPAIYVAQVGNNLTASTSVTNSGVVSDRPIFWVDEWPPGITITQIHSISGTVTADLLSLCPLEDRENPVDSAWNCLLPSFQAPGAPPVLISIIATHTASIVPMSAFLKVRVVPFSVRENFVANNVASFNVTLVVPVSQPATDKPGTVEWWILLLAILGGIILMSFIVRKLKRSGFFARKSPPPSLESDSGENDFKDVNGEKTFDDD